MLFPFSGGEGTGWKSVVHHTPHKAPSPTHSVLTIPWQRHVPRSSNLFLLVCVCVCYSLFVATSFPTPPQPFHPASSSSLLCDFSSELRFSTAVHPFLFVPLVRAVRGRHPYKCAARSPLAHTSGWPMQGKCIIYTECIFVCECACFSYALYYCT